MRPLAFVLPQLEDETVEQIQSLAGHHLEQP